MTASALSDSPKPFNLLCSSEPLLLRDWLDDARQKLRQNGYEEIENSTADNNFDWNGLLADSNMMSLFSAKKCQIITIVNGKPGKPGSNAILALCDDPPEDSIYIFVLPIVDRQSKNSSWFKKLQSAGDVFELPAVYENQLSDWIIRRAATKSLAIDNQSAHFLAERTEGNLLAADQELEKLSIRFSGQQQLDFETIESSVSQSARYNHFVLVEACLAGDVKRALKVLSSLKAEGFATPQLRWSIQSSLEQLDQLAKAKQQNALNDRLWQSLRIWRNKQRLYQSALNRLKPPQIERLIQSCATLDRLGKGQEQGDFPEQDWVQLTTLITEFGGAG